VKLSIIIPVYNEEQTISEVVERVRAVDIGRSKGRSSSPMTARATVPR
jgi:cellulose synthase/poly-beta-1,6-N-acetylglucosamine synthase-like glycosyltransferase